MAFTLWNLMEASLLLVNAMCILHEERFLAKVGWGAEQVQAYGGASSIKARILHVIRSVRTVMRIPLIFINIVVIVMKFFLG